MPASNIICNRLKDLEEILGISPDDMARIGECSRSAYYRYRNGESVPDIIFLNNILENETMINAEWLLMGKKPVLKKRQHEQSTSENRPIQFVTLPLFSMRVTNKNGEGRLPVEEWKNPSKTLPICNTFINLMLDMEDTGNLFAMLVNCDSMKPAIEPKSVVLVDKNENDPSVDGIFVVRFDDQIRMKLIQRLPSRQIQLSTINSKFNPLEISLNDNNFEIIGRIIWRGSPV